MANQFLTATAARQILAVYDADPIRRYHTSRHALHVRDTALSLFDRLCDDTVERDLLEVAALAHDAVYVPGNTDNEEVSAELAGVFLGYQSAYGGLASERVAHLIMATIPGSPVDAEDLTEQCISDADLSLLAVSREQYLANSLLIKEELGLPDEVWKASRIDFLNTMLGAETIYHTEHAIRAWTPAARGNLRAEIEFLEGDQ